MKVFHTADWHFREKDHDEIYKCVRFIADKAVEEKPDLICISGDITDSRQLNLDSRSARSIFGIIQSMLDVSPVAIVIGTPSHDGKAALALRECRGKYPILVSDMPGQYGYEPANNWFRPIDKLMGAPSLIITQIPQPTKQYFINDLSIEDTEKAIGNAMGTMLAAFGHNAYSFTNIPHIVNGHGQIGGAFISETQQLIGHDIEVSKSQLEALNADLVCYGHIHKAQSMGDGIFYSGSPTRMSHGEKEDKGFYIHNIISDEDMTDEFEKSKFIKTPAIYLHDAKFDLTKGENQIDIMDTIESMCEGIDDDHDKWGVKITITAWQDSAKNIDKTAIEKVLISWGAESIKIAIVRKPRETVRAQRVLEVELLPEKLKAMGDLRGEAVPPGVISKAKSIEAGEQSPWILEAKKSISNTIDRNDGGEI